MNCWPSGKYVNLLYMYSILGRGYFCFNYCLNSAWHGGDQFVALLRLYGSPGFFDSGLQLICIFWSLVSHFPLDNTSDDNSCQIPWHVCVWCSDALTQASVHSLWSSPKFLNRFYLTILTRLRFSRLIVHLFLPHFFLPLNFLLRCFDTALCEQPASLAMNVCGLPSLWRVSMIVFWTTVRSAVFPMIV